jgi:HlyD family secretion protein
MLHAAQPIDLRIATLVSGTLESASSATVVSEVEGEAAILTVVPEGTRVAEGDIVVELDSSALRARETEQQIVVENARAAGDQLEQTNLIAKNQAEGNLAAARLVVEFARLDLEKYEKGDYPLELRQLQIETALAQEELERARVQQQFSEDLARDGYINQGELEADRSRVTQASFKLENARGKERSLQDYTYPRTKRDLESKLQEAERALTRVETQERLAAEQALANLKAKRKTLELEEGKLAKLRDQLAKCSVRAPQAGMVVYPVPPDADMIEDFIKQGNRVKERQHVFSIPDTEVLQVTASVHEALVNRIRPGLSARITVDVIQDLELSGSVEWISPTPEPGDWRRTTVKFYETKVRIDGGAEGLRPGMSAKVEILIEELPDALAVPVQSVVQRGNKGVCYVVGARPELRRLRLGKSSNEYVQVLEGLAPGELVVMSPDVLGIPADAFEEAPAPDALRAALASPPAAAGTSATFRDADPSAGDSGAAEEPEPIVQELEYEAELTGVPVTSAMAEFKIKTKDSVPAYKFKAKISGGPPNITYEIKVDHVSIGSVTLDDTGSCALELSTKLGNFPPYFPLQAGPGSIVELGSDLKGTLALVTP